MTIKQDRSRFRQIVRGQIKDNLRKFISQGELIGRKGKDTISIPLPQIDIPRFRYGSKNSGGVGQGEGDVGDAVQQGDPNQPGNEPGAGKMPGEHVLEVDVDLGELAEILGEELELPKIQPRGEKQIAVEKDKMAGLRRVGPESLRHFKRTYREALKRQIASGAYSAKNPVIIPIRDDKRYRSWKTSSIPQSNAVIVYMMDVSGSMGDEQKEIVRIESFWIDTWLRSQYNGIESRYIIHDATAREVDAHTFFHTRESGGTMISSAYKLCQRIIEENYSPEMWNIYPFHFSDGDNWSQDDTSRCMNILNDYLLPNSNVFCYGQVESPYGSGQFLKDLQKEFPEDDRIILSEIQNKDAIVPSIKEFLGKGK
jgi:sporulation protein YhbH